MIGRILIFSGTTEGRVLAERLSDAGISSVVCVATEYGSEVMRKMSGVEIREGRMDVNAMKELMCSENFAAVCDATHPFATAVTDNIKQACKSTDMKYIRIKRNIGLSGKAHGTLIHYFETNEQCAQYLENNTDGKVLLTIGSKELSCYCQCTGLRERLVVRVLPAAESIEICKNNGIKGANVIAMQGPFSAALNEVLIREYGIQYIVTKESGSTGGYEEKIQAAGKLGIEVLVIGNPDKESGISAGECADELIKILGKNTIEKSKIEISLIGIGMGSEGCATNEVFNAVKNSDYIFGAKRVIECLRSWGLILSDKVITAEYTAEGIIPILSGISKSFNKEKCLNKTVRAAVLFSGDSGFYSGAEKLKKALEIFAEESELDADVCVYPGISSVSYLASKAKVSYSDSTIISIHGRGTKQEKASEIIGAVMHDRKTFILLSGAEEACYVSEILTENGLDNCKVVVGFNLSEKSEKIMMLSPEECLSLSDKGSYILLIINDSAQYQILSPCLKDNDFIRGNVPMTKEEIRELAICKLRLNEDSVCYDIGSGTGSVAVEIAKRASSIMVYAIEQKPEGIELIKENAKKHHVSNIIALEGIAPEAMAGLPAPTHVFIGGSSGKLEEIIRTLRVVSDRIRVVITAVTVETTGSLPGILEEFNVEDEEIIQVQVSRAHKLGAYNLFKAENPVTICSFTLVRDY